MLQLLTSADAWIALATLTVLEIVLGIDNIIFLALIAGKVAVPERRLARRIGLSLALLTRIALLTGVAWVIKLSAPIVTVGGVGLSLRDLVLGAGGLFLLTKGTREIHGMVEGENAQVAGKPIGMLAAVIQIALFDIIFSIDSVVTAVGMVDQLAIMIVAIVLAMLVMLVASGAVAEFVERRPTVKMLALSFLLLIGMALVADAAHFHIPRGYLYFAVAFSGLVEALNQVVAGRSARNKRDA